MRNVRGDLVKLALLCLLLVSFPHGAAQPPTTGPAREAELLRKLKSAGQKDEARVCNEISEFYQSASAPKAREFAERALASARKAGDRLEERQALIRLGQACLLQGDLEGGAQAFQQASAVQGAEPTPAQEISILCGTGDVVRLKGDLSAALDRYQKALALAEKGQDELWQARVWSLLGVVADAQSRARDSEAAHTRAMEIAKRIGNDRIAARAAFCLGEIRENAGDHEAALARYLEAFHGAERTGDLRLQAIATMQIGNTYYAREDYDKALEYYRQADTLSETLGSKTIRLKVLNDYGCAYSKLGRHPEAVATFEKALAIARAEGLTQDVALNLHFLGAEYMEVREYGKAERQLTEGLKTYEELGAPNGIGSSQGQLGVLALKMGRTAEAVVWLEKALATGERIGDQGLIADSTLPLSEAYEKLGNPARALALFKRHSQIEAALSSEKSKARIEELQTRFETDRKDKEIRLLKQTEVIHSLEIKKQKMLRNSFIAGFILSCGLVLLVFQNLRIKKRDNRIIAAEKAKSEALLLNTLPAKVVEDLKLKGATEPEAFEWVTVLFSDLVDFTIQAAQLDPKVLIAELNDLFSAFDAIIDRHGCERIKTIGDAYLAVCGMPQADPGHAEKMCRAALEILAFVEERNRSAARTWRIRIGIHTGKVVGGVVGVRKYIYDVFGDTINTAQRMESHSEPMRINVSEATHARTLDTFTFSVRPLIEVKGKGPMQMYFLENEGA
jgi:adenylate cyclase